MKKINLLFSLIILFAATANCQEMNWKNANSDNDKELASTKINLDFRQGVISMSQGAQEGYSFLLKNTDSKMVKDQWKDYVKDYDAKLSKVKKSDEFVAEGAKISSITGIGQTDIYTLWDEQGDDISMTVWFDMGNGKFLNARDYANSSKEAESFLNEFAVMVRKAQVEEELKEEESNLKKMENDLDRLIKKKESLEKDVENYKKRIEEAETEIKQNITIQEESKSAIEEQKLKIGDVTKKLKSIH